MLPFCVSWTSFSGKSQCVTFIGPVCTLTPGKLIQDTLTYLTSNAAKWSEDSRSSNVSFMKSCSLGGCDKWGSIYVCAPGGKGRERESEGNWEKRNWEKQFPASCWCWAHQGLHPFTCEWPENLFWVDFAPSSWSSRAKAVQLWFSGLRNTDNACCILVAQLQNA